ncbi:D-lysine 5,6-aminomutase subunit alpha [Vulcanibacillus modesticaldus]|uniref:D-lysine 5,6-aminomutase subunit alpha n=1 Tax=Vulcanibacillus modesticaldus TaxID=337097 RepID=A0A1D2YSJ1_9BACI|nr:lysine 5,6-aminomutase subunit alpha [Vulcanibacillus modesticaldus]OEF97266.1 D-lysine 5,6-aminomutase subunit alpha [Vulcanibacillus modesticaldus]
MGKLYLNQDLIEKARHSASVIADQINEFVDKRSTDTIERTLLRLMGIDGANSEGIPYVNLLVDHLKEQGNLDEGAVKWVCRAMITYGISAQEVANAVDQNKIDWVACKGVSEEEVKELGYKLAKSGLEQIKRQREERNKYLERLGEGNQPYLYVIVATGDIYEDVIQAQAAARQGADIIAVIRTTGQSLLDYVPYGATREGFGGTYATQENFKIMRKALDEVGEEVGRYIRLCNYSSGLCMPEIAAMGAVERLDVMLNDALYGILFRDINMQRTLIDQAFSRMIIAYAGIIINTGEDNYLTTADAVEAAHTVLASQFINEQLAKRAGLKEEQMGLGHAFEINPDFEDGFLLELAQAQMVRQIFPNAPIKYMPPTKYMTGNIFKGHIQDAMFNFVGMLTGQGIQLLGMMTEAMHTPYMQDRQLSIENAKYVMNNIRHLSEEIQFLRGGRLEKRANEVLEKAAKMLDDVEQLGLFKAIEQGMFADVKRSFVGGKGLDGVFDKRDDYFNPFEELLKRELGVGGKVNEH